MGRLLAGALLLLTVVPAAPAEASTVLRFGLDDLVDRASIILHGQVTAKQARHDQATGAIVTDVEVAVTEALKGIQGSAFAFTIYGGILGQRGSSIAGAAEFEVGEEILVFLGRMNRHGVRGTIGLSQGKYTIREVNGKRLAFRDLEGLRLMDRRTGAIEDAKPEQGVPIDELLTRVRTRIAAAESGEGR